VTWLLLWIHVLALATWLGETIFFGAVAAPALFGGLDRDRAGEAVALIFPGYYAVGYACGALLVVTGVWLWRRSRPAGGVWIAAALIAAAMLAASGYAGIGILPELDSLRPHLHDADAAASITPRFDALHRLAVELNTAVLGGGLVLSALLAVRLRAGIAPARRLSRYGTEPLR
jgi:hypothetical protein